MKIGNRHSRRQSSDVWFDSPDGSIGLYKDAFVDKSRLYALKKKILAGKSGLDTKQYSCFFLEESGEVSAIVKR